MPLHEFESVKRDGLGSRECAKCGRDVFDAVHAVYAERARGDQLDTDKQNGTKHPQIERKYNYGPWDAGDTTILIGLVLIGAMLYGFGGLWILLGGVGLLLVLAGMKYVPPSKRQ